MQDISFQDCHFYSFLLHFNKKTLLWPVEPMDIEESKETMPNWQMLYRRANQIRLRNNLPMAQFLRSCQTEPLFIYMLFLSEPSSHVSFKPDTPRGELMKILRLAQKEEYSIHWSCESTLGDKVQDLLFTHSIQLKTMDIRGFIILGEGEDCILKVLMKRQISPEDNDPIRNKISEWLQISTDNVCTEYIETTEL